MTDYASPQQEGSVPQSAGIDPKIGGLLAYFTWIGGLIMLLTQKHSEVRFHGAQSILFNIALFAIYLVIGILQFIAGLIFWALGLAVGVLYALAAVGGLVLWIVLAIKGYKLVHYRLPVIGKIAEKWAAS